MTRTASALVLLALLAPGCAGDAPSDPDVITVALAVSPNNLDPRIGSDDASQRLHQLIFNGLFKLDENLRIVPDLAVGMETPDDKTYRVSLRQGVRFHDGRELTAEDVVYTFRSFLDPSFVSPRKGAYSNLQSVEALDRNTVEFTLRDSFASFPINLVMGIVESGAGESVARRPVGTGPYRFVSYKIDDRVVLGAYEDYFEGPPRNRGVVLKVVPDDTMRGLELRKGTVDLVVNDLSPDIVHQLAREGRLRVVQSPGCDYAYLGFNLRDPILRDVRVRQAIGFSIHRDAIVKHLRRGLATPAVGILPPMSWAYEPDVFTFSYDPSMARRLLDAAGHPDPDGDGPMPRFRLLLKTSTAEFVRSQAAVIQQDLRDVGVAVEIRSYEFATLYADVLRGNFQIFTLQWVNVSDPDILRRVFHSKEVPPAGFNRGFFSDPVVDALIDKASESTDEQQRRALYGSAQKRIAEQAPYISLWHKINVAVFRPSIGGVSLSPTADFASLKDVYRIADPVANR